MSAPLNDPHGIAGLKGRESIPVAVSLGIKSDRGFPIEKDRFHIVNGRATTEERQGKKVDLRGYHPLFDAFNRAAPELRRDIPCVIAHASIPEFIDQKRQAYVLPDMVAHPMRLPVCRGDGAAAVRWVNGAWKNIPCPGDECPFTKAGTYKGQDGRERERPAPCKPTTKIVLRFAWHRLEVGHPFKGLSALPFKYMSGGWNTAANILGFQESLTTTCENIGVDPVDVPLFGMPVRLQLYERSGKQQKFSVAELMVDGGDITAWIVSQMQRREQVRSLAAADRSARFALTGPSMRDGSELADDRDLYDPSVPGGK